MLDTDERLIYHSSSMSNQLSLFAETSTPMPYTVSQLTAEIRRLIESAPGFDDLSVEGEISNWSRASSGHCYFTLKDASAEIGCVMWRSVADAQPYLPTNGDHVLAHGRIGVYEARGRYQLYVDRIQRAGIGMLYMQFEQLKARLEAEGLFAPERKQSLPLLPRRIGVVTSPNAAAFRDIINVLDRRYPLAGILLAPTLVQGDSAPPQIVEALGELNQRDDVDVIIVARGGGSLEELWAFNDERVARAVAASHIPVICGVGHETDFSLADFAADVRAPTPSAAAEIAVPDQVELRAMITGMAQSLGRGLRQALAERRWQLNEQANKLTHLSPEIRILQERQRLDELAEKMAGSIKHRLAIEHARLDGLTGRLEGIDPLATLKRGYAIVRKQETEAVITAPQAVSNGDSISVQVAGGEFSAEVT